MIVKVRKEIVRCANCKHSNDFLYLSDCSYGERLVLYNNGHNYAYLNLYENKVYDEFVDCILFLLKRKRANIDKTSVQKIVNNIFSITCDKIEGTEISLCSKNKCINCGSTTFEDLLAEPETVEKLDMVVVTHENWMSLSHEQQVNCIKKALSGYLLRSRRRVGRGVRRTIRKSNASW